MKVAFCTQDMTRVDAHFGWAKNIAIYEIDSTGYRLLEAVQFNGQMFEDGNEDKLAAKLELLDGCIAVYCRACGASAVRQLLAIGVQPVKVSEAEGIAELIETLQAELREGPSAWLAKAIRRTRGTPDQQRFEAMAGEAWDE